MIRTFGAFAVAAASIGAGPGSQSAAPASAGITAVPGIRVGHFTLTTRPTGCTVVLAPPNTVGGVDVRGGAPGTIETDVLAPDNMVQIVNAITLSGGSAYGLATADGVKKYLEEQKIGFPIGGGVVPIVPGAIIFDLGVGGAFNIRPDANCGYQAASHAISGPIEEGSVGAGAGATVGKFAGPGRAMKGGVGTASLTDGALIVGAIVVVNASGSVVDPANGRPVAGVRAADGKTLVDPHILIRGINQSPPLANTTIGVVATNAKLTKAQALRIAEMAHDGMARAIVPSHTPSDGDTLFVLGTGSASGDPNVGKIGALAAEVVSDAILELYGLRKDFPAIRP